MKRWWQSDVMYAFRHAPVALTSFIVVAILIFNGSTDRGSVRSTKMFTVPNDVRVKVKILLSRRIKFLAKLGELRNFVL